MFHITHLPHSSHVVRNVSSAADVASCPYEQTIVPATTAVTSQCYTMVTSYSKQYKCLKSCVGPVRRRRNHVNKYWLNFVVLTSWDKNKLCRYVILSARHPERSQRPSPNSTVLLLLSSSYSLSLSLSILWLVKISPRYLLWNRGAWRFFHDTYLTIEVQGIRCTNHLHDSCPFTNVNPHFTAPGCRYYFKINSWWPIVTS